MKYLDCLSLMELLEIRDDPAASPCDAHAHLEHCERCRAALGALIDVEDVVLDLPTTLPSLAVPRREVPRPERAAAGELWLASAPTKPDWRYPVAVLGRPKHKPDTIVVAPLFTEIDQATDLDLIVPADALGYPAAAAVWNYGSVFDHQLDQYLGNLSPDDTEAARALHRHVVSTEEPPRASVGPPLADAVDPRRLFRRQLLEQLQPLYEPSRKAHEDQASSPEVAATPLTLSVILKTAFAGPHWDRQSLLERADIAPEHLDMFLSDQLSLTYQHDVEALAKTLKVLELDLDRAREPVMNSLLYHSRGGERQSGTAEYSVAARAETGASDEDVTKDLYRGIGEVDESFDARQRAAEAYWLALVEQFEDDQP